MTEFPAHGPLAAAFLFASIALALAPGPAVVYIVTRTLAHGRRAGLASVAGIALGNLGNAIAASAGLAALLAVSATAFTIVKLAGAAYLVYLGVKALGRRRDRRQASALGERRLGRVFQDGFVVALLNPKTTLFFAAFLPQFFDPNTSAAVQGVLLGSVFVLIAAFTDTAYVLAAGLAAPVVAGRARAQSLGRYASSAVLIGLGVFTAVTGSRPAK
jgi:threonine/homoserine/homoserine lactone efflux protein